MYNLMLVDDEPAVVRGLAYDIEWSDLNISAVYKAYTVDQALRLLEQTRIDLVITDIAMPDMDGVELTAYIRKKWPSAHVIFLSGYDDFAYAQKAIELGVIHYATKPVDYDDLKEIAGKAIRRLEQELVREDALRSARESLEQIRPLLQERTLTAWVVKGTESPATHSDKFAAAGFDFRDGDVFFPVILRIEDEPVRLDEQPGLLELALRELAAEWLLQEREGYFFPNEPGQWILFVREHSREDGAKGIKYMEDVAEPFKESVRRTLGCGVSIFFGEATEAGAVNAAFRKLNAMLRSTQSDNDGVILFSGTIAAIAPSYDRLESLHAAPEFSLLLDKLDLNAALERIDRIFQELEQRQADDTTALLEIYHAVSVDVIQASLRRGMSLSQWAGDNEQALFPFLSAGSTEQAAELKRWCKFVIRSFIAPLQHLEKKGINRLVEQAKLLVEEHYASDISVAEVASILYVHPNYLTRVFKAETGLSLMDYISKRRIERAKGLLAQPGYKVYEVAEQVGYESIAHFNRMFKRETGMSPKDYQKHLSLR